jgi:hypothetical protein
MNTLTLTPIAPRSLGDSVRQPFFPVDLPVSYDTTGSVASRFGDLFWDLSSMSADGTSSKKLYFYNADSPTNSSLDWLLREQHKALMWLHMDAGKTRSWNSLQNTNLALLNCCKDATDRGTDLYSLLTKPEWVMQTAQGMNRLYVDSTSSALRTLWRHRQVLGAPIDFPYQNLLSALSKEARSRPLNQQTPLIPSRVYCAILAALDNRMSVIENELDLLLEASTKDHEEWRNAPKDERQRYTVRSESLAGLVERMKKLGYEPAQSRGLDRFVAGRLTEHKVTLMLVIAAFTGMRIGEVAILPLKDVLVEFEHMGSKHYELKGSTHKLNRGVKRSTTWITSHQGARAVQLARRIALSIQEQYGGSAKAGQRALLFPSSDNAFKSLASSSFQAGLKRLRTILCPVIEQTDIEELDHLELAGGWLRDDIRVGEPWPLACHQLRRSLAVYGHRSGMVSLPALKAQLQHITQEMSSYYANGFSKAVNLVFDKTHFSHEWKAAKAESSYFAYALGVLFSDEDPLLGQGAQRMANAVESRNPQDTLRLFEENKLAYRETPLGGCVSTEDCKTDPLEPIPYDCLDSNCINLVVFGKRLEHIIKHQEVAVANLASNEEGSVEHRLEASHLKVLLKARERLQKGVR